MASRYTRDEIITQALDLAHSPTVSTHDAPGGIVQPNAWSIKWLQNALDMFHRIYPFASDITEVALTIRAGNPDAVLTSDSTRYLPLDFIIDVRNGLFVAVGERQYNLGRIDYQRWLGRRMLYQGQTATHPICYSIVQNRYKVLPLLTEAVAATAHYFALPSSPGPDDFVEFPDEFTLIEFIRLKALEWSRSGNIEVGTAQLYMRKQLAALRSSGLLNEAEYEDGIPLENVNALTPDGVVTRNSWMGAYAT